MKPFLEKKYHFHFHRSCKKVLYLQKRQEISHTYFFSALYNHSSEHAPNHDDMVSLQIKCVTEFFEFFSLNSSTGHSNDNFFCIHIVLNFITSYKTKPFEMWRKQLPSVEMQQGIDFIVAIDLFIILILMRNYSNFVICSRYFCHGIKIMFVYSLVVYVTLQADL